MTGLDKELAFKTFAAGVLGGFVGCAVWLLVKITCGNLLSLYSLTMLADMILILSAFAIALGICSGVILLFENIKEILENLISKRM